MRPVPPAAWAAGVIESDTDTASPVAVVKFWVMAAVPVLAVPPEAAVVHWV